MVKQSDLTKLAASARTSEHSRAIRRLRRSGRVPGVLYGAGKDPVVFDVDARELRNALAASGAVVELEVGGDSVPAILKDAQRHPVRGETMHIDLLRVDLDQPIQSAVPLHLVGAEDSPGVKEGGVLDQVAHEVNVEALPREIPEYIEYDVSGMEMNDTITLSVITAPAGVTLLDDPAETTIATLSPPRVEEEPEEIESETELVGEDGEPIEAAEGETGETGEAPQAQGESADDAE